MTISLSLTAAWHKFYFMNTISLTARRGEVTGLLIQQIFKEMFIIIITFVCFFLQQRSSLTLTVTMTNFVTKIVYQRYR